MRKPGRVEIVIGSGIDSAGKIRCCMVVDDLAEGNELPPDEPAFTDAWAEEEINTVPLDRPDEEVNELNDEAGVLALVIEAGAEATVAELGAELEEDEVLVDSLDSSETLLLDLSSSDIAFDRDDGTPWPSVIVDDLPAVRTLYDVSSGTTSCKLEMAASFNHMNAKTIISYKSKDLFYYLLK